MVNITLPNHFSLRSLLEGLDACLVEDKTAWGHCAKLSGDSTYLHWKIRLGIGELLPHISIYPRFNSF
jgi:hypothetical protein